MSRLQDLAISDKGFVFDPWSGVSFTVNATGLAALRALVQGLDRDEVVARLREDFELRDGASGPASDLIRDVDDFMAQLRQAELLPREDDHGHD